MSSQAKIIAASAFTALALFFIATPVQAHGHSAGSGMHRSSGMPHHTLHKSFSHPKRITQLSKPHKFQKFTSKQPFNKKLSGKKVAKNLKKGKKLGKIKHHRRHYRYGEYDTDDGYDADDNADYVAAYDADDDGSEMVGSDYAQETAEDADDMADAPAAMAGKAAVSGKTAVDAKVSGDDDDDDGDDDADDVVVSTPKALKLVKKTDKSPAVSGKTTVDAKVSGDDDDDGGDDDADDAVVSTRKAPNLIKKAHKAPIRFKKADESPLATTKPVAPRELVGQSVMVKKTKPTMTDSATADTDDSSESDSAE